MRNDPEPQLGKSDRQGSQKSAQFSDARFRNSQYKVLLGLLVTFGGIFAYGLQIPTPPTGLASVGPWLAVGFVATWTGGILFGNSLIPSPPGIPPALRAQPGVAFIATLAGFLSATVVIQREGPWGPPSAGTPAELAVAISGVALAWLGGFLMGTGMRRFVRRSRRHRASVPV